ncbi:MAG: hypothetical protein E6J13_13655 [Chloroflexi bacterium]|nr:MAG: hypothetical protein E6J13_13655 [Chloroflexota bacterium]
MRYGLVLAMIIAASCGAPARAAPTAPPLISAASLSVHLVTGASSDAQERSRLPALRDTIAGALPDAWFTATGGRGKVSLRTDADIDIELDGTSGTSALTQHKREGKVVSRTIAIHTIESNRHLSVAELMATALHELGHIWCCYGPGTADGHWSDVPTEFSPVGIMTSPMRCEVAAGSDPVCPTIFSDRELKEMHLTP